MSFSVSEYNKKSMSAGALPQTPLGEISFTVLPRSNCWFNFKGTVLRQDADGGEGEGDGLVEIKERLGERGGWGLGEGVQTGDGGK